MTGINTFDDLIAAVERGCFTDIVNSGTDRLPDLLNGATGFFESFPFDDQMKAMACMVGMILGTLHGEPTAAGTALGVMITAEDRLRMFKTQAMVVFRESLSARGIPLDPPDAAENVPTTTTRGKTIAFASGKRKKRPRASRKAL